MPEPTEVALRRIIDQAREALGDKLVAAQLDHAVRIREANPGRPEDGPYPATVGEVADEVVTWLREMEQVPAPGLIREVLARLAPADPTRGSQP